MIMGVSFFMFGKFSSIILLKILAGPYVENLHSHQFLLSVGLVFSLCPGFPGCFELGSFCIFFDCCADVLYGIFYTLHSLFHLLYSVADACIYGSRYLSYGFYLQRCLTLGFLSCVYFPFRSSMVLFISITCLDVFSCFSLRTSTCLVVFSCFSLRTCNSLAVFSCISCI